MNQISLFSLVLPTVWTVNRVPREEGTYCCRVKDPEGKIFLMDLEFKDNKFSSDCTVLCWR